MRIPVTLVLLLAGATAAGAAPPALVAPPSASILLHAHPRPWRPPVAPAIAGMRAGIDPVTGELTFPEGPDPGTVRAARAAANAAARVFTRPDGSSHAVLNGLIRAYAVVRVGPNGRLVQDCVHSEQEALRRAREPAPAASPSGEE
jgi:hypothetical protein